MKIKILLILIILVASILRLYQLGSVPPSPDWDEVALGYNAYSILQTGKDEYGKAFPIVLQSFDDYKPAVYMYLIIPFIPIFGLDIIAVRLPSAILGILTVLATYFLVQELFKRKDIALVTAALLAISPWHIQFSRIAFETNTGLAFNVFAVLFFLKGLKRPWMLFLSTAFMGLNLSVYQSDRLFTPLLALALVIIFWKQLFAIPKKYLLIAFLIGVVTVAPLLAYVATNNQALSRAKGVSIFSEPTRIKLDTEKRYLDDRAEGNPLGPVFHNQWVGYTREALSGYLSHYDLGWLFIRGDLSRHHAPAMALFYLWEIPFLLLGIYGLIFLPFSKKTKALIFAWFLLAPVPAAFTNGVPHSIRTLNFLPTFQIFISLGLITSYLFIIKHLRRPLIKGLLFVSFFVFVIFNFLYYLNQYFIQQNYFYSKEWQYGYEELIPVVQQLEGQYDKIVVSNQTPLDQSYMFFLFYLKYPPENYQKAEHGKSGFQDVHRFDKYEFRHIDWGSENRSPNILYIGRPEDLRDGILLKTIYYLDGTRAIKVVQG